MIDGDAQSRVTALSRAAAGRDTRERERAGAKEIPCPAGVPERHWEKLSRAEQLLMLKNMRAHDGRGDVANPADYETDAEIVEAEE